MNRNTDRIAEPEATLILFAFRYALGRTSTAPSIVVDYLLSVWERLDLSLRKTILRELEDEFARDDEHRKDPDALYDCPLGWNCDRKTWERLRNLQRG